MLIVAAALFAIAALGGLVMVYVHFRQDRNPPGWLAVLHGLAAAAALLILMWAVAFSGRVGLAGWSFILFALAALGGFFLASVHLRKRRLPSTWVVAHALVAIAAFGLLLVGMIAG